MTHYALTAPIKNGKTASFKTLLHEMQTTRERELKDSRKRMGIEKEEVWLQHTPNGDFAVIYWECKNPDQAMKAMMSSEEPFDKWFREKVLVDVHGFDPSQTMPMNEPVLH
jgi:L-rhamnose mutarotase